MKEVAEAQAALAAAQQQLADQSSAHKAWIAVELEAYKSSQNVVSTAKDDRIAALEKELKNANNTKDMWYAEKNRLAEEIETTHCVLDAIAGAPPREMKSNPESYSAIKLGVVARFAGHLANRNAQG